MLGPEVVNVGHGAAGLGQYDGWQPAWLTLHKGPYDLDLVLVDVGVGDRVVVRRRLVSGELREHQRERGVLHHVRRDADRYVAGALVHVQMQPVVEDADVYPAMARGDRGSRSLAGAANLVLRDPRRDEMRPVGGQLV